MAEPTLVPLDTPANAAEYVVRIGGQDEDNPAVWVGTRDHVMPAWLAAPETWLAAPGTWLDLTPRVVGDILAMSPIERYLDDLLGGFLAVGSVSITLDNRAGGSAPAYNSLPSQLGFPVTIWEHDREAGVWVRQFDGVIDSGTHNGDWTVTVSARDYDLSVLDTPIPQRRATVALFGATCPSVGAVLPKVIGHVNRVPLTYVVNDVPGSIFIYHVSEGAATVRALYRDRGNGLQLMDPVEYTWTSADSAYPNMTVLRTYKQQTVSASGGVYDLYADVSGPAEERNPARAFQAIVGDTTWGLGQRVDTWALGEESLRAPANVVIDAVIGGDGSPRPGREWMRELLMICEGVASYTMESGWAARWDWDEPTTAWGAIAAKAPFGFNMVEPGTRIWPTLGRVSRGVRLRYGWNPHQETYRYITADPGASVAPGRVIVMGDGQDRGPSNVFQDRTAADRASQRLAGAVANAQDVVERTVIGTAGRRIQVRDLIGFEAASLWLPDLVWWRRVIRTRKTLGRVELDHVPWSAAAYGAYTPGDLPDLVDDDAANETDGVPV